WRAKPVTWRANFCGLPRAPRRWRRRRATGGSPTRRGTRNPGNEQADWDLDTYAARVLRAIDAVREITGSDDVNTIGFCAGGVITTGVLNHLAATGDTRIRSASFAVTLLDFGQRAPIQAF